MIPVPRKGEFPPVESVKVLLIINLLLLPADFGIILLIKEQTKGRYYVDHQEETRLISYNRSRKKYTSDTHPGKPLFIVSHSVVFEMVDTVAW